MRAAFGRRRDRHEAVGPGRLGLGDDQGAVHASQGAPDAQHAAVEVDVRPSERASASPRRSPAWTSSSNSGVPGGAGRIEQLGDLGRGQVRGLVARHLRSPDRRRGMDADRAVPDGGVQDRPQHRVRRPDGRLGMPLAPELDDPALDVGRPDLARPSVRRPIELPRTWVRATPVYRLFLVGFCSDAWSVVSSHCAVDDWTVCRRSRAG